jgi:hypothetical protein
VTIAKLLLDKGDNVNQKVGRAKWSLKFIFSSFFILSVLQKG